MAQTEYNTFDIPKGGYAAFDATSLRQLIVNRLNEQGTFTDQNYVGSNLAAIIDIISYTYNTLIYYLNRTSTESLFTEAQLYENINRIVKLIDYSPVGAQTSTLSFNCSAENFSQGLYTLPRYSYVQAGRQGVPFSFNEDITFNKTVDNSLEYLQDLSTQKLLYQGIYQENPPYTAAGDENETVILNPGNKIIDHFNIDVYVKRILTGKWEHFYKTSNLYLENSTSKKYEIRLNQNKRYEIKFGNDINGYKLQTGDVVGIYYLQSAGENGVISSTGLQQAPDTFIEYSTPKRFETIQYNEILNDVLKDQYQLITGPQTRNMYITNNVSSTEFNAGETAEQIRENAPSAYQGQYRLVTSKDYEVFIKSNFSNFVSDVKVFNNSEYVLSYLRYYADIGITDPEKTDRALFNQVHFADSCNFNNVYLVVVPKSLTPRSYLLPVQKETINSFLEDKKILTSETVFIDPVYKAIDFGVAASLQYEMGISPLYAGLVITKQRGSQRSDTSIKQQVINVIKDYFSYNNNKMGQIINIPQIAQNILDIEGVYDIHTARFDENTASTAPFFVADLSSQIRGLSLLHWNPIYTENDKTVTTRSIVQLPFQYTYFNNIEGLSNRIIVKTL